MAKSIKQAFQRYAAALAAAISLNAPTELQANEFYPQSIQPHQPITHYDFAAPKESQFSSWLRGYFETPPHSLSLLYRFERPWEKFLNFFPSNAPYRDTTEIVAGKIVQVSANVHEAFSSARIPAGALIATCARESGCDPAAVNPTSKACGLFQLMTDRQTATLYEAVYLNAAKYGYIEEASMVDRRYVKTLEDGTAIYDYFPVSAEAKEYLITKCLDPKFNTDMHEGYTLPKIMAFEKQFGRPMTYGDLAGANNLGFRGWKLFVEQVEEDRRTGRKTSAPAFFKRNRNIFGDVSGNVTLLRDSRRRSKTVEQSYLDVVAHGGAEVIALKDDNRSVFMAEGFWNPSRNATEWLILAKEERSLEPSLMLR